MGWWVGTRCVTLTLWDVTDTTDTRPLRSRLVPTRPFFVFSSDATTQRSRVPDTVRRGGN